MNKLGIAFIVATAIFGFWVDGITGAWMMLLVLGFFAFVWFALLDGLHSFAHLFTRPTYIENKTLNVHVHDGNAIRGIPVDDQRNPDPTRPPVIEQHYH